ncbi:hypothetical protein EHQ68_16720 [Leptospira congkakensis]|uniref:Uncharacterized protein n=1 Tax=Leptospira congkakensis TaxID=2484932 RepID=A0A8B5NB55_9LEPT|nr:hypothetical protein [Leptospira congkakensis]TGL85755.1 hypothetical protein EHQ68_16720 [Leptospira congkakensis]TGL97054.1 hypothetical protein EHQ69_00060 [Leptospira congkakensis]
MKVTEQKKTNLSTTLRNSKQDEQSKSRDSWEVVISKTTSGELSEKQVVVRVSKISSLFE